MGFQQTVNIFTAFGVVGEPFFSGPKRVLAAILDSSGVPNKVGNAFTYKQGANSEGAGAPFVEVGGSGDFAGILINPKVYTALGTVAGGPLAPTLVVADGQIGELAYMDEIVVNLPGPANVNDLVTFDPATGDLNSIDPLALFTGAIATTTLTVSAITAGRLDVGSVISGVGIVPGTVITALGSGLGGTGTYTVNNSQSVSSEAMSSPNTPAPAFVGLASLADTGIMTVGTATSGELTVGSKIIGTGFPANTVITAFGTGVGGTGTYTTNATGLTLTSRAITSPGERLIPNAVVDRYQITDAGGLAVIRLTQ